MLTFSILTTPIFAQADKILGIWYNEPKDAKIEVYKKGDLYFGKIIWLKNNANDMGGSPRQDLKNPDPKKQQRPIVGINIVTDLKWDSEDEEWNDGEIYDPRSGNTYSVYAQLESENKLFLKGYIGFSLIGRSTYWTRISE